MCITPIVLPNGQKVACRQCWQCRENRINDWVGRCIAEIRTAKAANSITLTYGVDEEGKSDHLRAAVLTYSDVQKYLKRLRRAGFPCRYFAVGEYGSVKGRAHWHLIMFWQGAVPEHKLGERFIEKHWPLGWSFWDKADGPSIRYVCKYITKDIRSMEVQGHLSMSKKPPLGAAYFVQRAGDYVRAGLSPRDAMYSFAGEDRKGVTYMLRGRSLDLFCQSFIDQWTAAYPGKWWPPSDLIEAYCDRSAALLHEVHVAPWVGKHAAPWIPPPGGVEVRFSEPHNAYYCEYGGRRLWWSYDLEGKRAWQNEIRTERGNPRLSAEILEYRNASMGLSRRSDD